MTARTIMVQGTASSVGKSMVTAALCRIFRQEGLSVAPFKSQNMALNAFVTADGGEIGRAQAVQAKAAGVTPTVFMNPILLKPEGDSRSQVVVLGKAQGSLQTVQYGDRKKELRAVIEGSLEQLRSTYDVVVIEGAGSPAEINLKAGDIVNMFVAELADAPVLLVGDIDRGGIFASFVGTLELLDPHERARIVAFVVNKFRGDIKLLEPGLDLLRERTGIPVLGVLPYMQKLRIADEDSLSLEERRGRRRAGPNEIEIAVVRLPHISNYDDFLPLEHESGVVVRFVENARELEGADLAILPGTKSTLADLAWVRETGIDKVLIDRVRREQYVLGICGGCQMLGETLRNPHGLESEATFAEGLGLLGVMTEFGREKRTTQLRARVARPTFLGSDVGEEVVGYEIHMGRVRRTEGCTGAFTVVSRNDQAEDDVDGAVSDDGSAVGTMIHGIFDNESTRRSLLSALRLRRGLPSQQHASPATDRQDEFDRLASVVRENIDMNMLLGWIGR